MTPAVSPQVEQPLSQLERVTNVFAAPRKTFRDINRSASWWVPFLIMALVSFLVVSMVDKKIGLDKVTENQLRLTPRQAERLDQMPPAQRQQMVSVNQKVTKAISYGFPVVWLLSLVVMSAILMGSFNFGQGTQIRFGQSLAVVTYANLVGLVKSALMVIVVLAGADPDGFLFQNPVATNLGYFLNPGKNLVLYTLASSVDIITIWVLVLVAIGFTCISKLKKSTALGIVFGWWALLTLLRIAGAAMS